MSNNVTRFRLRPWIRAILGSQFLLLFALTARADVVTLNNGDRVTGAVEGLKEGKLTVKTDWGGQIPISWDTIAGLESAGLFEVETETGRIYRGSIRKAGDSLSIASDSEKQDISVIAIRGLAPVVEGEGPGFWRRLEGGVDFGYSLSRGNSNSTQSSFGANARYRQPKYEVQGSLISILSEQEGTQGASRHALDLRYDRFLSERTFLFALGGLERNEPQLLNLRSKVGGGVGHKLINTKVTTLSLLGGANYSNERFRADESGVEVTTNSGEALAGVDFRTLKFFGTEFTTKFFIHPNLTNTGRYRIEFDSGLRVPLIAGFTWGIAVYDRYDNEPPVSVKTNDYGLISTLGYKF